MTAACTNWIRSKVGPAGKAASMGAVLLLSAFSLFALTAAPVHGAEADAWGEPVLFNMSYHPMMGTDVAMDEGGNATMVWTHWNGCDYTIAVTVAAAGEAWGTPQNLTDGGCGTSGSNNTGGFLSSAMVAGRAAVLVDRSHGSDRLAVAFFDFDDGWGALQPVGGSASRWISGKVVLDINGTATVVWEERDLVQDGDIYARTVRPNGSLGETIVLEDTTIDVISWGWGATATDDGTVSLVWSQGADSDAEIHAARILPNGSVSVTVFYENLTGVCCQALFYAANAHGHQVMLRSIEGGGNTDSWVRTAGPDGVWSDPSPVDRTDSAPHQWADVAIDGNGEVLLLWKDRNGSNADYSVESKPAGRAWQPRAFLAGTSGEPEWGRIVANKAGGAVATWSVRRDDYTTVFTAVARDSNGSWGAPFAWAPNGTTRISSGVQAAIDGHGNAFVLWLESNYTDGAYRCWLLHFGAAAGAQRQLPQLMLAQTAPPPPTTGATFEVVGSVDPGTAVSVQGDDVPVRPNGSFSSTVPLAIGSNTIVVVARSPSGLTVTRYIVVERQAAQPPPAPEDPITVRLLDPWRIWLPIGLAAAAVAAFVWLRTRNGPNRKAK